MEVTQFMVALQLCQYQKYNLVETTTITTSMEIGKRKIDMDRGMEGVQEE